MRISPLFAIFVLTFLIDFPLIMIFGDHLFKNTSIMNYVFSLGIFIALVIGLIIFLFSRKDSFSSGLYTNPIYKKPHGMPGITLGYFFSSKVPIKRKILIFLLPFLLFGGMILIIWLAVTYKIL